MQKQKVLLIGAGFAGIQFAKNLDENLFELLLIDKINHHQFQPLFYQVATSQIEPSSISFPIRNIFNGKNNVQIRLAEVTNIDTTKKYVYTNIGNFNYDILVLAMGCKTNFFGNSEIEKNVFTLKSTYEAITIRNHILQTFEDIISAKEEDKEALLNLVIVGAGPTGVELAGAFAEIKEYILPKDYPKIDFSRFKISLIEGSKHSLNNMSEHSKISSEKYLRELGINLITETFVKNYDGSTLLLSTGETIITKTVIWAAGVTTNLIEGLPKESITFGNRYKVNRINKIEGVDNVYAIGDVCYMETPLYPKGHPQVANVAINQAKILCKNLKLKYLNKQTIDYEYKDLGSMATIGRNKAVVDLKNLKLKGYIAWLIWMFLHLMLILSVKNKLIIFINWAWAYITKDSSLRLILRPSKDDL
jgi:NADH:ubiquinone reductase (H+-translocating)